MNKMKILVTGCNGQLGKEINKIYNDNTHIEIINTDVAELDITSIDATLNLVKNVKPNIIINCAAHTEVNACETDFDNAFKINALGPRNLSIAATEINAKMLHISTDYVFDGQAGKPYIEIDKPNPQGVYGLTKLAGEEFVKQFADKFFIIRTAWLYGDGKNFVKTMLKLSETNDKVRVVSDQFGTPTSTYELAKMIEYLLPTNNYGTFHGTCEGSCNWAEFAEEIFRLAGKKTKVEHITTSEYPTPAARPPYSVLDNYMLRMTSNYQLADWKEGLSRYILNSYK
jgi:dTDP-4-dehydrorhamnose reductase